MSKKKNNLVKSDIKQLPPEVPASIKKEQNPGTDLFLKKIKGKEIYFLLAAVIAGCCIVFKDFITFEKVYLFKDIGSDTLNIYFPWLTQISGYIKTNGIPTWTFSQGLGQNVFPLWLGDFFGDLITLFDKEKIPYLLAWVEMIKIVLCAFVFYKYLAELKLHQFAVCVVSFLFAFSGYIILGGGWFIFSSEALDVAIILYGFERWLSYGKFLWLVVGFTLLSFLQPFLLFTYAIFFAVYIPVRFNDVRPGEWRKFPGFILKTAGLCIIGVAISAYQLFPDLLQYIESPRVGGEAGLTARLKLQPIFGVADELLRFTTTFRAFSSDMLGSGSAFQGWQNYLEAPVFYCGILCLVTFPQMFAGINKAQKIAYGIFAGLFFLPVIFPFFRYSFWAYAGDYFRTFSLVITLLLLLFTAKALDHIVTTAKVNLIVLGITVACLLALLYTPNEQFAVAINTGLRSFATLLILVYAGILYGMTRSGDIKKYSFAALAVIVFFEMVYFSSQTVNERDVVTSAELKDKVGYNDYTVDAIKYLKNDDKSFYRVNKDYSSGMAIHQSINDAKVQGYFGSASYHSFNQKNYIKFLGTMGVLNPKDENATRWAMGVSGRPLLLTLTAGKYWLSKRTGAHMENMGYDSVTRFGNVSLFKNRFALPLSFAYDTVLPESLFKNMSPFQKDLYLLKGCVIADDDKELLETGKKFDFADTTVPFSLEQYGKYVAELRKDTLSVTLFKEKTIKGNINLTMPKILFFSIPYDEGWKAKVNGADAKLYLVNCGLTGLKLQAGKSDVELYFEPRYMKMGGMVSLAALAVFIGLIVVSAGKRKNIP